MRFIVGLVAVALVLWCGWWFLAAKGQEAAWAAWIEDRRSVGWVAETEDIGVRGFPNRLDTTITDIELADPVSGWAWSAPFFQVLMVAYQPNHIIAVLPQEQLVSAPQDTVAVTNESMRGSVVFAANTRLSLDRLRAEIIDLNVNGSGWEAALDQANLAINRLDPEDAPEHSYALGFDAANLTLPVAFKKRLDPAGLLPAAFETAHVDLVAAFDAPWDRLAIEGPKPQPTAISVKDINVAWGELKLSARGLIDVDARGFASGDLEIEARNWREILNLAVQSGILPADLASSIEGGVNLLTSFTRDPSTLNLPLTFSRGQTLLGPIPVGPAPRLTIR